MLFTFTLVDDNSVWRITGTYDVPPDQPNMVGNKKVELVIHYSEITGGVNSVTSLIHPTDTTNPPSPSYGNVTSWEGPTQLL